MQQKTVSFVYHEYEHPDELAPSDRMLLQQAKVALQSSHAPYSGFNVGAAIRLENDQVVTGSNQENMAFPSSLCAERVASSAAASTYPGIPFTAIAITARAAAFEVSQPTTPCGGCRQVLMEYERLYNRKIRIIMMGESGKILVVDGIDSLLPLSFHEEGIIKFK